jgi:hypothetical protein
MIFPAIENLQAIQIYLIFSDDIADDGCQLFKTPCSREFTRVKN